jgi:hypothetical protein
LITFNPKYLFLDGQAVTVVEPEIVGFDEVISAPSRGIVTVNGFIDTKFLCLDVTNSQTTICTTALVGNSSENKSMYIHLKVCNDSIKSVCIVWKPDNLCSENTLCSEQIKVYDTHSKLIDPDKKVKLTGEVVVIEGKGAFKIPIEKIEAAEKTEK